MLLVFLTIGIFCSSGVSANISGSNANQYCVEMSPQQHVDVEQLMGIWYAVEIIDHESEIKQINDGTCIIMYLSEENDTMLISPLYKNFSYGETYGYSYNINYRNRDTVIQDQQDAPNYGRDDRDYNSGTYGDQQTNYNPRSKQFRATRRGIHISKHEGGNVVEYVAYYTKKPSVWSLSGPQNGSYLPEKFNSLAGTVQVMKAVAHHLVLTFCHRLPDQRLYTMLLSRQYKLSNMDIHGVHNLLTRKGLDVTSVQKICTYNTSTMRTISYSFIHLCLLVLVFC